MGDDAARGLCTLLSTSYETKILSAEHVCGDESEKTLTQLCDRLNILSK